MTLIELSEYKQSQYKINKTMKEAHNKLVELYNRSGKRKNDTINFMLFYMNKNKHLFPGGGQTDKEKELFRSLYSCSSYVLDYLKLDFESSTASARHGKSKTCQKYKLCSQCAYLKSLKNKTLFLKYLNQNPKLKDKNYYFITVGVKHNIEDKLLDSLGKLHSSLSKMNQAIRDYRRGENFSTIFRHFHGCIIGIEVTYTPNGWNPHAHILVCTDHNFKIKSQYNKIKKTWNYSSPDISEAWLKITGDSFINSCEKVEVEDKVHEILKYVTKFSDLPHNKRLELYLATPRFRFLRKWGLLKGVPIDEKETGLDFEREKLELYLPRYFDYEKRVYKMGGADAELVFDLNKRAMNDDIPLDAQVKILELLGSYTNGPSNNSNYNISKRGRAKVLYKIRCPKCSGEINITKLNRFKGVLLCKHCHGFVKVVLPSNDFNLRL